MLRRTPLLIALFSVAVLGAAPEPPGHSLSSPSSGGTSADTDDVYYDSGPARYIDKLKLWQMTGGVTLNQGDAYLKTQAALVNLDKDLSAQSAKSLAPVHFYDDQNDVTADHAVVDFTTHIATLTDHITLIARPGKTPTGSLQSQSKDPSTMTCETILYDYRHKTGKIPGALTIRQKDRVLIADSGTYDGNAKTVTLVGHVRGTQSDGSVITVDKLIAGIADDNQWIYIPGPVHAVLKVKKSDSGNTVPKPRQPVQSAPPPDLPLPSDATPERPVDAPPVNDNAAPSAAPTTSTSSKANKPITSP